jgi:hypothetical protein
LLEALSAGTIAYLSWREERHLTAAWSLNTELVRLLTQFFSLYCSVYHVCTVIYYARYLNRVIRAVVLGQLWLLDGYFH